MDGRQFNDEDRKMKETTRTRQKSEFRTIEKTGVTTEISKVSVVMVGIFGVAVGLWSLACLVGGLVAAGGPFQLAAGWFKAVSGI
ncbi:hypothetical protein DGMP_05460 [Desulfomarina profundi]|uniref:Uncharacterized protein n=2 Tax=Desulfomarina profundi TaxID=2772557 RepID=A0A8D5JCN3_9BACT|nr:hypothetical protein DGMP_05460 [Desulfomarina profundi]